MLPHWGHWSGHVHGPTLCVTFPSMIQPCTTACCQPSTPQGLEGQILARTLQWLERALQVLEWGDLGNGFICG